MGERRGHFTEPPILPEVPAPPPDRILVRGARLVRIYDPPQEGKPSDGGREAVVLAWARLRDRTWAGLVAWTSYWAFEDPPQNTALARWGWYVLDEQRVKPMSAPRTVDEDADWHGWAREGELSRAIAGAVLLLPPHLREAAMRPAPDPR